MVPRSMAMPYTSAISHFPSWMKSCTFLNPMPLLFLARFCYTFDARKSQAWSESYSHPSQKNLTELLPGKGAMPGPFRGHHGTRNLRLGWRDASGVGPSKLRCDTKKWVDLHRCLVGKRAFDFWWTVEVWLSMFKHFKQWRTSTFFNFGFSWHFVVQIWDLWFLGARGAQRGPELRGVWVICWSRSASAFFRRNLENEETPWGTLKYFFWWHFLEIPLCWPIPTGH